MKVILIDAPIRPLDGSVAAARTCYSPDVVFANDVVPYDIDEDEKAAKEAKRNALADSVFIAGHHTTIQHAHFTFALEGISRQSIWSFFHSHPWYNCVSGDTIIPNFNQGDTQPRTIAELCSMNPNRRKLVRIRSVDDEGNLVPNQIKQVAYSGKKKVFRVKTLMGYEIKATAEHRFMREDGSWARLGKLKPEDRILVNGVATYKDETWMRQKYHGEKLSQAEMGRLAGCSTPTIRKWIRVFNLQKPMGSWSKGVAPPNKGRTKENYEPLQRTSATMKEIGHKPPQNGLREKNSNWKGNDCINPRDRAKARYMADKCAVCGRTKDQTKRFERHHRDGDIYNNEPENVLILCALCHKAAESPHRTIKRVTPDVIESIELVGVEDTYDIEMEAPFHNFVGNGFILHNSEQVSQRYVEVRPDRVINPFRDLGFGEGVDSAEARDFDEAVEFQMGIYHKLIGLIEPVVAEEYYDRFPDRAGKKSAKSAINKKALEVARYVLPIGTMANMYHTVSLLTLIRYFRTRRLSDVPTETQKIVDEMVARVIDHDPDLQRFFKTEIAEGDIRAETTLIQPATNDAELCNSVSKERNDDFDAFMDGKASRLVDYPESLDVFFHAINETCNLTPPLSKIMGSPGSHGGPEALNLDHHHPIRRAMAHVRYTFRHRLSHTADSQDQRHRTTPASRPMLSHMHSDEPDFIIPALIKQIGIVGNDGIKDIYEDVMDDTWTVFKTFKDSFGFEPAQYILPNALTLRYTESADLSAIRHKMSMRLCMNAQEEIFRIGIEEAAQIAEVHPEIGKFLVPPCTRRLNGGISPKCPEGDRYCGVPVWKSDIDELVEKRGIL